MRMSHKVDLLLRQKAVIGPLFKASRHHPTRAISQTLLVDGPMLCLDNLDSPGAIPEYKYINRIYREGRR